MSISDTEAILATSDVAELDNLAWHALTTVHQHLSIGTGPARRYDPEVAGFVAVNGHTPDAWSALGDLVGPGQVVLLSGQPAPEPPQSWRRVGGGFGFQMILQSPIDADIDTTEVRVLTRDDVDSMLELVALTEPGPFRGRTIEMGNYVGIVRDGALIAMAGERLQTHRFVEVSAVCTHPTVRGQGLASLLVTHVARGIQQRGKVPVLHVAEHNDAARRVYLRLGFEVRTRLAFVAAETPS